ncbi:hypothetical protein [Streptomyces sp. NPDC050535]|uniref:hypothetical protein n=1 Tax=Streptomyces sp. NPDC050535 TaxID=3365626 RepID=UPI0037A63FCF
MAAKKSNSAPLPANDPEAAGAASRLEIQYLAIVADLVGESDTPRYGALLMAGAHGIAGLKLSGHLAKEKGKVDGEQLVRTLVDAIRAGAENADSLA